MLGRALTILLLVAGTAGAAEPVLRVRARTRIDLTTIERIPKGIVVRGQLTDVALAAPIAGRVVAISVSGAHGYYMEAAPTGPDGVFQWRIPLPLGGYTLKLQAGGDDDYAPAPGLVRTLDLARRTPTLALEAPQDASVAGRHVPISVDARDPERALDPSLLASSAQAEEGEPVELPIALLVDGREVAALRTRAGHADFDLDVSALGPPGSRRAIEARFAGDAERNPTSAVRSIRVTTPTHLTLAAAGSDLVWDGTLRLSGSLTDAAGPIPGATVSLFLAAPHQEGREVAAALTDGHGRFVAELSGGRERPGVRFVEARFAPNDSFREPSRSPALALTVLPPRARSLVFFASPLLLLVGIGLYVGQRRRPWRALGEARRARREAREARTASGLSEGRPRLFSTLRAPADHGLSGQVCELPSGAPLPTATVVVTASGASHALPVDEQGRFALEDLPAGPLEVEVSAPGFVSERFSRALPHRGELRSARVLLVPIRARIFDAYRELARALHPRPGLVEICTPRELYREVERRRMIVDDLAELTALVEVACFGPRLPGPAELRRAEELAALVVARAASEPRDRP